MSVKNNILDVIMTVDELMNMDTRTPTSGYFGCILKANEIKNNLETIKIFFFIEKDILQ